MKRNLILLVTAIALLAVGTACKKDKKAPPGPTFNIDVFEQNLINYVNWNNDKPIAWAYTISQNGTLKKSQAFGSARLPVDGYKKFTLNKEINVASISKFYTAIAALQLIEANNLTTDDNIEPWLPASWQRGPGVDNTLNGLTFKDLLKHTSGLNSINSSFDSTLSYSGLRACIQTGVVNAQTRSYLNVNFALFRVLIPSLWSALPNAPAIDIESDANTQFMYLLYMQENIFDLCGLTLVGCTPEARADATLYYNVNDSVNNQAGSFYSGWNNKAGGGGYFMTPIEMAAVNAYFEHTELLLPKTMRDHMKEHRMGFNNTPNAIYEQRGKVYGKNGSIGTGGAQSQGVLGANAIWPTTGIDCVVIMNTQGVTFNDPSGNNSLDLLIYQAYLDAWE
jgi:CubicO group peptidase (beta-lactamase class C family)